MTLVGLDDTDSRERGMCTTYAAARIAGRIREADGHVARLLLIRLNPAVKHKTRGNAALCIHTDCDPETAFELARDEIEASAETADPRTNPGLVVSQTDTVSDAVKAFARDAVTAFHDTEAARKLIEKEGLLSAEWKRGRGLIGALAAVGAWDAFSAWTYEYISYRPRERWGTERDIDYDSVFAAAKTGYPAVWDTVDEVEGQAVCVPHTPGPILHGIRGDDPAAVREVAHAIESEPVEQTALFTTNQGTDAHLKAGTISTAKNGHAYRLPGRVITPPETKEGGHVFFDIESGGDRLQCAAFEPTKRFRDRVRALRVGDDLVVCGELSRDTLKLEKFAVRELNTTALETPECPTCGRRMKSAGAKQGYRCRDCNTSAPGKVEVSVARNIEHGWYEVPPCARRHIAKPLVRGGFECETHTER
ncbi:tRNA(Ile)(2)-agmatinylcytidine synthase [Haladaptatus sp. DJG-WS-42]|uniref:tRNA(Ile)(2)-agmatinylcytidine synthase n=1 Tax=Haladaptatus sp. DJG-WS-42 TaxID=3120516 RepID=UPI0030D40E7F